MMSWSRKQLFNAYRTGAIVLASMCAWKRWSATTSSVYGKFWMYEKWWIYINVILFNTTEVKLNRSRAEQRRVLCRCGGVCLLILLCRCRVLLNAMWNAGSFSFVWLLKYRVEWKYIFVQQINFYFIYHHSFCSYWLFRLTFQSIYQIMLISTII